jgi:hypothetical protein
MKSEDVDIFKTVWVMDQRGYTWVLDEKQNKFINIYKLTLNQTDDKTSY